MEDAGVVDMGTSADPERALVVESLQLLQNLKTELIEAATAFNELKASPVGRIKIYGIAKTAADFMLFRNGFKMIFSLKAPGQVSIRFNFIGPHFIPTQTPSMMNSAQAMMEEHMLVAKPGAFNDVTWTFQNEPIKMASVVKYHLSLFIKESAK